ncbi:MBL fold metallo-hydrolase [Desmospora profundinema]|uniref:Glyoxylase-like metal-dependent hydrolase (Beta-lactamase superfamily II) n=1 Tax=Desmospora profundinema TaxID=1571184 RepID=A0ABU1INC4_9BACL|nr:MBL fold metallo-hydrolase [Desmospora profundinema]MDR6226042.1 glyoxylase-like metal-dependent hydrolase (beta-lactamase superfamily II) [Desmospora profundinema]
MNIHEDQGIYALQCRTSFLGHPFQVWLYTVDGVLLDTGPPRARSVVTDFVDTHPPWEILLTHYHEDHSGNAAFLSERYGAPVWMGKETARLAARPSHIPFYRRVIWGQMDAVRGRVVADKIRTRRHVFRPVITPGHSHDHVAWLEEERGWLFSGDLFVATRLAYGMKEESVPLMIQSLRHVLSLPVERVYCCHAGIIAEGRHALEKKLHFLEHLQDRTITLHRQGKTIEQITFALLEKRRLVEWFSRGEMSPMHLIRSIVTREGTV